MALFSQASLAKLSRREAIRRLKSIGPPTEWTGALAAGLGNEMRKLLTRTWAALSPTERTAITSAFRGADERPAEPEVLAKGEQTQLTASRVVAPALHAPIPEGTGKCGGKALMASKGGKRRWQCVSRQRQAIHSEAAHAALHQMSRAGGSTPLSRAAAERPHYQHLKGEGLIKIERNPVYHTHEFTAHLTRAGHKQVAANREARGVEHAHRQAALFKSGPACGVLWLLLKAIAPARGQQLSMFGARPSSEFSAPPRAPVPAPVAAVPAAPAAPASRPSGPVAHVGPGPGWEPVPGGEHGGFRKKSGAGYRYWYPDNASMTAAAAHHEKEARRLSSAGVRTASGYSKDPAQKVAEAGHFDVSTTLRAHLGGYGGASDVKIGTGKGGARASTAAVSPAPKVPEPPPVALPVPALQMQPRGDGWEPIPQDRHDGYRKLTEAGHWAHWYPSPVHAAGAHDHHRDAYLYHHTNALSAGLNTLGGERHEQRAQEHLDNAVRAAWRIDGRTERSVGASAWELQLPEEIRSALPSPDEARERHGAVNDRAVEVVRLGEAKKLLQNARQREAMEGTDRGIKAVAAAAHGLKQRRSAPPSIELGSTEDTARVALDEARAYAKKMGLKGDALKAVEDAHMGDDSPAMQRIKALSSAAGRLSGARSGLEMQLKNDRTAYVAGAVFRRAPDLRRIWHYGGDNRTQAIEAAEAQARSLRERGFAAAIDYSGATYDILTDAPAHAPDHPWAMADTHITDSLHRLHRPDVANVAAHHAAHGVGYGPLRAGEHISSDPFGAVGHVRTNRYDKLEVEARWPNQEAAARAAGHHEAKAADLRARGEREMPAEGTSAYDNRDRRERAKNYLRDAAAHEGLGSAARAQLGDTRPLNKTVAAAIQESNASQAAGADGNPLLEALEKARREERARGEQISLFGARPVTPSATEHHAAPGPVHAVHIGQHLAHDAHGGVHVVKEHDQHRAAAAPVVMPAPTTAAPAMVAPKTPTMLKAERAIAELQEEIDRRADTVASYEKVAGTSPDHPLHKIFVSERSGLENKQREMVGVRAYWQGMIDKEATKKLVAVVPTAQGAAAAAPTPALATPDPAFEAKHALLLQLPGLNAAKFQVTNQDRRFVRSSKGRDDAISAGKVLIVGNFYGIAAQASRKFRDLDSGDWKLETTARAPRTAEERKKVWDSMFGEAERSTAFIGLHDADDARDYAKRDEERVRRSEILAQLRGERPMPVQSSAAVEERAQGLRKGAGHLLRLLGLAAASPLKKSATAHPAVAAALHESEQLRTGTAAKMRAAGLPEHRIARRLESSHYPLHEFVQDHAAPTPRELEDLDYALQDARRSHGTVESDVATEAAMRQAPAAPVALDAATERGRKRLHDKAGEVEEQVRRALIPSQYNAAHEAVADLDRKWWKHRQKGDNADEIGDRITALRHGLAAHETEEHMMGKLVGPLVNMGRGERGFGSELGAEGRDRDRQRASDKLAEIQRASDARPHQPPGAGWEPIPHGTLGGFRKRRPDGSHDYWYRKGQPLDGLSKAAPAAGPARYLLSLLAKAGKAQAARGEQLGLFAARPATTPTPAAVEAHHVGATGPTHSVHIAQHIAHDAHGGVHVVKEHEQHRVAAAPVVATVPTAPTPEKAPALTAPRKEGRPVDYNDYRAGATKESAPKHFWLDNVLGLAHATWEEHKPFGERLNRAYQAGESAGMAADELRILLWGQGVAQREQAEARGSRRVLSGAAAAPMVEPQTTQAVAGGPATPSPIAARTYDTVKDRKSLADLYDVHHALMRYVPEHYRKRDGVLARHTDDRANWSQNRNIQEMVGDIYDKKELAISPAELSSYVHEGKLALRFAAQRATSALREEDQSTPGQRDTLSWKKRREFSFQVLGADADDLSVKDFEDQIQHAFMRKMRGMPGPKGTSKNERTAYKIGRDEAGRHLDRERHIRNAEDLSIDVMDPYEKSSILHRQEQERTQGLRKAAAWTVRISAPSPLHALRKGLPDGLDGLEDLAKGIVGQEDAWNQDGYSCRVIRARGGMLYLTIDGPDLALPYHMEVENVSQARQACNRALPLLRSGRVPMNGVFRKPGVLKYSPRSEAIYV